VRVAVSLAQGTGSSVNDSQVRNVYCGPLLELGWRSQVELAHDRSPSPSKCRP